MDKSSERMKKVIAYAGVKTNKFSKTLGYNSPNKLYHIISGRNDISREIAGDITRSYPEINRVWLLTGEGEMLNHSHNEATYNTQKNNNSNNGDNSIYINSTGAGTTTTITQDKENAGQCNEIKEMTKLLNQLYETKIIEIDRLTKLYNGIISNQNEFIDTLKEQNSQYRKEIESLRQRIKGNTENSNE